MKCTAATEQIALGADDRKPVRVLYPEPGSGIRRPNSALQDWRKLTEQFKGKLQADAIKRRLTAPLPAAGLAGSLAAISA